MRPSTEEVEDLAAVGVALSAAIALGDCDISGVMLRLFRLLFDKIGQAMTQEERDAYEEENRARIERAIDRL